MATIKLSNIRTYDINNEIDFDTFKKLADENAVLNVIGVAPFRVIAEHNGKKGHFFINEFRWENCTFEELKQMEKDITDVNSLYPTESYHQFMRFSGVNTKENLIRLMSTYVEKIRNGNSEISAEELPEGMIYYFSDLYGIEYTHCEQIVDKTLLVLDPTDRSDYKELLVFGIVQKLTEIGDLLGNGFFLISYEKWEQFKDFADKYRISKEYGLLKEEYVDNILKAYLDFIEGLKIAHFYITKEWKEQFISNIEREKIFKSDIEEDEDEEKSSKFSKNKELSPLDQFVKNSIRDAKQEKNSSPDDKRPWLGEMKEGIDDDILIEKTFIRRIYDSESYGKVRSEIKPDNHLSSLGFISPDGEWYSCEYAGHESLLALLV